MEIKFTKIAMDNGDVDTLRTLLPSQGTYSLERASDGSYATLLLPNVAAQVNLTAEEQTAVDDFVAENGERTVEYIT
ncbi:MAG: hypothetical protein V3T43_06115 [Nitrosomonadaceae bacterium]